MNESGILDVMSGDKPVQVSVSVNNEDLAKFVGGVFLAVLLAILASKTIK